MKPGVGVLVVAALGLAMSVPVPSVAAGASSGRTALSVTVDLGSGQVERWTLRCDPTGGTHPNADRACALLARDGADLMSTKPTGLMCTQVYGGPEQATVAGLLEGVRVRKHFNRSDGCQTALWARARPLFTVPGTVVVRGAISLGPTCPGPQVAGQAPCEDPSVAGRVRFTAPGRESVLAVAEEGRGFAVRLTPGRWTARVSPTVGNACQSVSFRAPTAQPVTIACDTGIR